jgi:Tfp pilus assembly protein FimT
MALIDVVAASALSAVLMAMAVPVVGGTLERERAASGARFIAGQLQRARLDALRRSQSVAVRFVTGNEHATMRLFADGNGNGVLQRDVDRGIDAPLAVEQRLDEQVRDVTLRINQPVKDVGGSIDLQPGDDPLRIGNSSFVTFTALGTATNGTLYISGPRGPQYAVRIFGATGRIRILSFDASTRQWLP